MRRYTILLALVACLAMPLASTAEITWTDIGGDISLLYFYSANVLDFDNDGAGDDDGDLLRSEIHLNFKADLDDNVSVVISMEADRDLGSLDVDNFATNGHNGFGIDDMAIFLEEAYITIAEPMDLPFTLTGGRFFYNLGDDSTADDYNGYWGDGAVIGDGDATIPGSLNWLGDWETDPFDGVKAVFDYDTFVLDAFWLLATDQNDVGDRAHDTEVLGLYGTYLGLEGMQLDGYFTWLNSDGTTAFAFPFNKSDQFTAGARWAGGCMDDTIAYKLEGAYQFGEAEDGGTLGMDGDIDAFFVEAGVNWHPDMDRNPEVGFMYTLNSGDDDTEDLEEWLPVFENKGYGMIADAFVYTNTHIFNISAGIDLTDDLRVHSDWYYFLSYEDSDIDDSIINLDADAATGMSTEDEIGFEVDAQLDYTFSDNVDAFVGGGVFFPGDAIEEVAGEDDEAYFVRTGVKVAF